ncbi:MAG: hypothetical protein J7M14_06670, partial [Planctomycetes bacterium]|nr:hypothetical protein [Planctomycetota bacterium]
AAVGPRIIVFDVGGVIELQSDLRMRNGALTIAAQTAPGGVTLIGAGISGYNGGQPVANDYIIRHLRVRGLDNVNRPGQQGDCIMLYADRAIVDHCSFTGSADETFDMIHSTNVTVQWTTIEESALQGQGGAQHEEGDHNLGLLLSYNADAVATFTHNVFAHHKYRMPGIYLADIADFRNNVVYNWRSHAGSFKSETGSNLVGNTWKVGPNTTSPNMFYNAQGAGIYMEDNQLLPTYPAPVDQQTLLQTVNGWDEITVLNDPVPAPAVVTQSAGDGYASTLAGAGAWPRDATTRRIMEEIQLSTGEFGLNGPYEKFATTLNGPTSAAYDTDRDGMPDAWEDAHGLNPSDPADRNNIVAAGASAADRHMGYTYIEYYINELADNIVGAGAVHTVEVSTAGEDGLVVAGHSGLTPGWGLPDVDPLYVEWGDSNIFNHGSYVTLRALAQTSLVVGARTVSRFSHWSGGTVDGVTDPVISVQVNSGMQIVANFAPLGPEVSIVATDSAAAEAGPDAGAFTVRIAETSADDLDIGYVVSGSAGADDYVETLSGTVTIPAGELSAVIIITPVDDDALEGDEQLVLTLAEGEAYVVGASDSAAVTIVDNERLAPSETAEMLGSWTSGLSHTVEGGSRRVLIFTAHTETDAATSLASVTYGGEAMTPIVEAGAVGDRIFAYAAAFYLDEAGIAAAGGSDFVLGWTDEPAWADRLVCTSVFLGGADQQAVIRAADSNVYIESGANTSRTISTDPLFAGPGDMAFVASTTGATGSFSVNNDFTEALELEMASSDGVVGYKAATGVSETPSVWHSNVNRICIIGFVVASSPYSAGDADIDGDVDATDLMQLGVNWGPSAANRSWSQGDFDLDGDVDATDLAALGLNWTPSGYAAPPLAASEESSRTAVGDPAAPLSSRLAQEASAA